jgi:hypothetical protein
MDGVLCPIPAGIDECKRLAHEIAVHQDHSTIASARGKWPLSRVNRARPLYAACGVVALWLSDSVNPAAAGAVGR